MYEYLIYNQLKKFAKADKSFHVPGHKAGGDFKAKFSVAPLDVTELSYSDNLACPDGVIAEAQKGIAEILGAKKSYILTDGSSCGILAMLFVAARHGSKLIVPHNAHQSVWNACRLFGLEPVIVEGKTENGVMLPPDCKLIEELLANDLSICGMLVTSPDYYGNIAPLDGYSKVLHKYSKLLIVDGAHGAHLAFEPERKGYAGVYADMWVDGAHKSLPTLTQGAVLSINNRKLFTEMEDALSIFRTTSPSYPIMASVEYGIKFIKNNPKLIEDAKAAAHALKEKTALTFYPSGDWTKLAVDFAPLNMSADAVAAVLEKKGIYAELSDGRYLLFYLSPTVSAFRMNRLSMVLSSVAHNKKLKGTYFPAAELPVNERTYSFQYAIKNKKELVPLKSAVGRMCAYNAGLTPPCTPVVITGEIITETAVKILTKAKNTYGLYDGKVWVVKK